MKSRTALASEAYLDSVYAYLPPVVRDWASRPDIREQWMVFAVSHVKTLQRGIVISTARDLAEAIEHVWREQDIAPPCCVVCGKPRDYVCQPRTNWIYIPNVKPSGAMVCSAKCDAVAADRFTRTGRVDECEPAEEA